MKIYFIRHGESEANIKKMHAGQYDSPLTANGERDAAKAGKILCKIKFDKVYTSDLSRTVCTQKIALPEENAEKLKILREIDVGELEGKTFEFLKNNYGEDYINNVDSYNFKPYGGEDYEMLAKRAEMFLNMVKKENRENVAVFSHGGFINAVLGAVLECKVTNLKALSSNCGISIFKYNEKKGLWALQKWDLAYD